MTQDDIEVVRELIKTGLSREQSIAFLRALSNALTEEIKDTGRTKISGLGAWTVHKSTARKNQSSEARIYFAPFRNLKESLTHE